MAWQHGCTSHVVATATMSVTVNVEATPPTDYQLNHCGQAGHLLRQRCWLANTVGMCHSPLAVSGEGVCGNVVLLAVLRRTWIQRLLSQAKRQWQSIFSGQAQQEGSSILGLQLPYYIIGPLLICCCRCCSTALPAHLLSVP